ncbi:hypothetical protein DACRYDRAFT_20419 [Dacryopinax primogenitus]|uniref:Uncharacterized protein n=1 Tax=Dacryopinax primogenitus (strain DJM 731) TaxID=1858805 RepID=M5G7S4_DACPD|nr:uncharacterized protein DACRYDRAFT_20419 [Dacryopinax primogenitus]EJU04804.1 hypothetical protein DACRYDRAFT_20419 [Dacryopinax primogenitus]
MGFFLNNIIGGALFGLAVRMWQLGLVNRPVLKPNELWTHASYMFAFGWGGYGLAHLELKVNSRLAELRDMRLQAKEIAWERAAERRKQMGVPPEEAERHVEIVRKIRELQDKLDGTAPGSH